MSVKIRECIKECDIVECWFRVESDKRFNKLPVSNNSDSILKTKNDVKKFLLNGFLVNFFGIMSVKFINKPNITKYKCKAHGDEKEIKNIDEDFIVKYINLPNRINEIFNEERKGVTNEEKKFLGTSKKYAPFDTKEWKCLLDDDDIKDFHPYIKTSFNTVIGPFLYFKFEIPKTLILIGDDLNNMQELTCSKLNAIILTLEAVVSAAVAEIPFPVANLYNLDCFESVKAEFCMFNGEEKGLYEEVEGDDEYDCCFDEDSYREILKK